LAAPSADRTQAKSQALTKIAAWHDWGASVLPEAFLTGVGESLRHQTFGEGTSTPPGARASLQPSSNMLKRNWHGGESRVLARMT
jgi:hypothetical protein